MKPAPFEYYAPDTIEEALSHLAQHGYDAKPLAGGQSLIPMMNFRLAQPAVLIDLNKIPDLSFIRPDENGGLLIGAMARHAQVERDPLIAERAPSFMKPCPILPRPRFAREEPLVDPYLTQTRRLNWLPRACY